MSFMTEPGRAMYHKCNMKAILPKLYDAGGDLQKQWLVIYSLTNPETGKLERKRISKGINKCKTIEGRTQAAGRIIAQVERQILAGNFEIVQDETLPSHSLLASLQEVFLLKQKTTRQGTWRNYKYMFRYLEEFLSGRGLLEITSAEFSKGLAYDFRNFLLLHSNEIARKTINIYCGYLSSSFSELVKMERLRKNPFVDFEKLRTETGGHKVYRDNEVNILVKYYKKHDPELWRFVQFLYYTLNRNDAIRQLRIADINLTTAQIRFDRGNAKSLRAGYVVIPTPLLKVIEEMDLHTYPDDFFVFGRDGTPGPKPRGKKFFWERNLKALEACGLDGKEHTLYAWKHTGAVRLYEKIKDLKRVSEQCLHADVLITMKYLRGLGVVFGNNEVREKFPSLWLNYFLLSSKWSLITSATLSVKVRWIFK